MAHLLTGRFSCVERAGSLFWERNLVDVGEVVVGEDSGRSPYLNSSVPIQLPFVGFVKKRKRGIRFDTIR
jgi:hypothetical protein